MVVLSTINGQRGIINMKRQQKYPETTTFHYYNANPYNRKGDDCVIRALCTAMNQTWEETLQGLVEVSLKTGFVPTDKKCYEKYLEQNGWRKQTQPHHTDGTKYTGKDFCRMIQRGLMEDNIIAHIGGHHIVAIMDGKVNDILDSTDKCIGNYWIKESI
jgi:hypothetical protein